MHASNTAQCPLLKLSIHVVIESAASFGAELNCAAPAAGLFVNKTFIRSLLDQQGHSSFLPLGENWPTHTIGQDGSVRETRAQKKRA